MRGLLVYLDARLGESSTWASISAALVAAHINVPPGLWTQVTLWGAILAAGAGVLLREAGNKPPATVAADVLAVLKDAVTTAPAEPAAAAPPMGAAS